MKEIWMNSELYIKSYEFSIFKDFFRIFSEFISILNYKSELKNDKKLFIFCAGPTWMRRGTQGHVVAPRGPTRRLCGVTYIYYYLYSI